MDLNSVLSEINEKKMYLRGDSGIIYTERKNRARLCLKIKPTELIHNLFGGLPPEIRYRINESYSKIYDFINQNYDDIDIKKINKNVLIAESKGYIEESIK